MMRTRPNILFVYSKNQWRSPTAEAIYRGADRIIATNPVVTIHQIDKHGDSWFGVDFEEHDGIHCHSLTILENDFWEQCD